MVYIIPSQKNIIKENADLHLYPAHEYGVVASPC